MGEVDHSSSRDHDPSDCFALELTPELVVLVVINTQPPNADDYVLAERALQMLPRPTHPESRNVLAEVARDLRTAANISRAKQAAGESSRDDHKDLSSDLRASLLLEALKKLLRAYVELIDSGDCGFSDSSKDDAVIEARAAIQQVEGK